MYRYLVHSGNTDVKYSEIVTGLKEGGYEVLDENDPSRKALEIRTRHPVGREQMEVYGLEELPKN